MNYTLTYREASADTDDTNESTRPAAAQSTSPPQQQPSDSAEQANSHSSSSCNVDQVLQLLKILKNIISEKKLEPAITQSRSFDRLQEGVYQRKNQQQTHSAGERACYTRTSISFLSRRGNSILRQRRSASPGRSCGCRINATRCSTI